MQPGNSVSEKHDCAVIIIGGGPCGLMLAIELGRRGVSTIVLEEKTSPARFPAANATQARTMEHYRRLGFAEKVRAQGMPEDYPTDIAYFTRYTKHELARFSLPSARAAREMVRTMTGSWSAAELPHRVSQMFVEDVLRAEATACPTVSIRSGLADDRRARHRAPASRSMPSMTAGARPCAPPMRWAPTAAQARPARRSATAIPAKAAWCAISWAAGCSPSISAARTSIASSRTRAPGCTGPSTATAAPSWRRSTAATSSTSTPSSSPASPNRSATPRPRRCSRRRYAAPLDIEIIARSAWNAGYTLVAEKFQRGRIFLGGDAAHLFTPTGGLGYNTAVEDAVNLGWKLNAVLKGWGGPALLDSYETERQAIARRNTTYARGFADSLGLFVPPPELEDETPAGEAARKLTGDHFNHHARFEFNIPGITFGGRYDGSPIVVSDGTAPPPDAVNTYQPTGCPGGRAPHLWLGDGRSLYDALGFEFTLLQLGAKPVDAAPFRAAAAAMNMPLSVVAIAERRGARALRRRSGVDPARSDRRVARQFSGRARRRAAPRRRTSLTKLH